MNKSIFFAASFAALMATNFCIAQTNSTRGVKREKEQCEELALQGATNPRASGSGVSSSEAVALNLAKLQARNELAAQATVEITGVLQHRVEQYVMTAGAGTNFSAKRDDFQSRVDNNGNMPRSISGVLQKDSMVIVQRVQQILTNTRPICQNAYDQPDGTVLVYVCIEMDLQAQRKAYSELKEEGVLEVDVDGDGKNDIDLSEREFLIELAKAREEYNAKKREE